MCVIFPCFSVCAGAGKPPFHHYLFLLNAIGYTVLAVALVLPGLGPIRWLVRYALIGFTAMTIVGWVLFGARFDLAYLDKAIELALIGVLLAESWLVEGGPVEVTRRALRAVGIPG